MAKGNRVDELDNQIETTEFVSDGGVRDEQLQPDDPSAEMEDDDDVDLTEMSCEDAVRANPKRLTAAQRRKANAVIEGLIDDAELSHQEGQQKAWQRLHDEFGTDHPQPFDISAELSPNDVVEHPEFGIGFVVELIHPQKVEVLFSEGLKKLACNID